MRLRTLVLVLGTLILAPSALSAAEKVTLARLVDEMVEMKHLAQHPHPPFVTKQFSSYDRSSEHPGDAAGWHANQDRGHPLYDGVLDRETPFYRPGPTPGRPPEGRFPAGSRVGLARHRPAIGNQVWVYATGSDGGPIDGKILQGYVDRDAIRLSSEGPVLAEVEGPGCIVRIWSANPAEAGLIRIFLDHAKESVITAKLQDLLGGQWETEVQGRKLTPFPKPFAGERSRGWNLFFPIPFAKHCRITAEKGDVAYQITYRRYPKETEVVSFTWTEFVKLQESRDHVRRQLAARVPHFSLEAKENKSQEARLGPGEHAGVVNLEGVGAIQQLRLRIQADRLPEALRSVVLVGRFDDAATPQIECPVGDFLGTGPGLNSYTSFPCSVLSDGTLTCNWRMPFARRARFELHNYGSQTVAAMVTASVTEHSWSPQCMHFHAKWRLLQPLASRPIRDETLVRIEGRGVFVGRMLSVLNPVSAWWGEGDERIYVDDDQFPSVHGTGTDDDFGLAWRDPSLFQHAYHNQTRCDGPGNFGYTSLNRFYLLDRLPFTKCFRYDLEIAPWTPNARLSLALTAYWYAQPGGTDKFTPIEDSQVQAILSPPAVHRVPGALEGESLRILRKSSTFAIDTQELLASGDNKWSGGAHLWARPTRKGEWAELELPINADGRYQVFAYLTSSPECGVVQFHLDGQQLGQPLDAFTERDTTIAGPRELGVVMLKRGRSVLRIESVGTHEKSTGARFAWGLDGLVLKPVMDPAR